MFGNAWTGDFVRDGFVHFPGLVSEKTVAAAKAAIDEDLAEKYDPKRKPEYDSRSFCPDLLGTREILALLENRAVKARVDALVSGRKLNFDTQGQVAIRRARNVAEPMAPVAHVDGFPAPYNGVEGGTIAPFTMLVGVFLTPVRTEFAGNFTVWPGSHLVVEEYFKRRGREAMREPLPTLEIGEPRQLMAEPGDVVLCHYALAHAAAVNVSEKDRVACFFRLWHKELFDREAVDYAEKAWGHLTSLWSGWRVGAVHE